MIKKYKSFSKIFLLAITAFVVVNYLVYNFATKDIFAPQEGYSVGDLTRLSYDPYSMISRKKEVLLPRVHKAFNGALDEKIDVITLGDSFTRGASGGLNPYFQDYIIKHNPNLNVYQVALYRGNDAYESILYLLNSGYLDKIKPKYIILESIQKQSINRLAKDFDFEMTDTQENVYDFYKNQVKPDGVHPKLAFISNANFKYLLYNFLYKFNDRAFMSKVYRLKADKEKLGKEYMLVYKSDIRRVGDVTSASVKKANENLNKLSKMLAKKGIKLYFMPAVDKFDLYYDYLVDCKYPRSRFFELIRPLEKDYGFIDSKAVLKSELDKGVIDVYYLDDTHWSHKASDAIFKKVKFD